jgi:hypothetical protein
LPPGEIPVIGEGGGVDRRRHWIDLSSVFGVETSKS